MSLHALVCPLTDRVDSLKAGSYALNAWSDTLNAETNALNDGYDALKAARYAPDRKMGCLLTWIGALCRIIVAT